MQHVIRKGIISSGTCAEGNDVKSANVKEQKKMPQLDSEREVDKHFRKQTFIFILSTASHSSFHDQLMTMIANK